MSTGPRRTLRLAFDRHVVVARKKRVRAEGRGMEKVFVLPLLSMLALFRRFWRRSTAQCSLSAYIGTDSRTEEDVIFLVYRLSHLMKDQLFVSLGYVTIFGSRGQ